MNKELSELKRSSWLYRYAIPLFCLIAAICAGHKNFLFFHCLVETFSVIIAVIIFIISVTLNSYSTFPSAFFLLGISYGFVGAVDFLHMVSYPGMGVFNASSPNLTLQLWIIARYTESISLILFYLLLNKKLKFAKVFFCYAAVFIPLVITVFYLDLFPTLYVKGYGITGFKIANEYIILALRLLAILLIYRLRNNISFESMRLFFLSLVFTAAAEITFAFNAGIYETLNIIGHIFKLISFFLICKTIVRITILAPHRDLKRSEEQYSSLIRLLPEAVMVVRQEKVLYVNDAALKLFEAARPDNIEGKSVLSFFPLERLDQIQDAIDKIRQGTAISASRKGIIHALDGTSKTVEIIVSACTYDGKPSELIVLHNTSEKRKAESLQEKLANEERKLKETLEFDRIKSRFLLTVSHEFKTPLNVISASIQLLQKAVDDKKLIFSGFNVSKHFKAVEINTYRLLRLINNLIDITSLNTGFYRANFRKYNIVQVVENVVLSSSEYIKAKGIGIVFDTDAEEIYTCCDIESMERIILNLLSNAVKCMDKQGLIQVSIHSFAERFVISIKDNGAGIPPDKQQKIFEPFSLVNDSLVRNHEGSGVGLALVKFLVETHGGSISVHSEVGEGSEFLIEFPVRAGENCEESSPVHRSLKNKVNLEFSDIYD